MEIVAAGFKKDMVSLQSDEFISVARCKNGEITCETKRLSKLSRFLCRNKFFPIPRTLTMVLPVVERMMLTTRGRILFALYVLFLVWNKIQVYAAPAETQPVPTPGFYEWMVAGIVFLITIVIFLFLRKRRIGPWRGAGHMVISAYERSGSIKMEEIKKENTIYHKSNSRLILPTFVGTLIILFIANNFAVNKTIISFVIMECVLWIDCLMNWGKIPVVSHFSHFFQRFVTTSEPGVKELETAQRAMKELLIAHQRAL